MDDAGTVDKAKQLAKWEVIKRQHEIGLRKAEAQLEQLKKQN